jgi:predicted amidohydrolase
MSRVQKERKLMSSSPLLFVGEYIITAIDEWVLTGVEFSTGRITCHCVSFHEDLIDIGPIATNLIPVRTYYYSKGTQLYCAPTVDSRPFWKDTMVHIALEGRCFVLSACQLSKQKDYPPDYQLPEGRERDPEGVMIAGGSTMIISPLGEILAGPLRGEEGVLSAEIDLDDVVRGKFDLDCVGHYSRSDSECFKPFS